MVACSWQFLCTSRLAFITWVSASLICPVVAQIISLACAFISWRALEASSAKDKQSWPLWFSLMHLLQTIWSQALSNTWKGCLWSAHKLFTARGSKETTWWALLSLLWAWKRAAPLHKSFLQFKQQKLAGCLSSQTSQMYELSSPFFWSVTFALIMSNNAKFFGSPATPAWGTLTSTLQVGHWILLSAVRKRSRQLVQKLWPQFSIRGQMFWSSKGRQQTEHSSPSADAIVWNKTENVLKLNLCSVRPSNPEGDNHGIFLQARISLVGWVDLWGRTNTQRFKISENWRYCLCPALQIDGRHSRGSDDLVETQVP